MPIEPALLISASALLGAFLGGGASRAGAVYTQRSQDRLQRVAREITRRETVYADFIMNASNLLLHAYVHDEIALEAVLQMDVSCADASGLDTKTTALIRLAGCIASQAPSQSFEWSVTAALDAGATHDDVVGVLVAVAPVVGVARVSQAATDIATALGLEVRVPGRT